MAQGDRLYGEYQALCERRSSKAARALDQPRPCERRGSASAQDAPAGLPPIIDGKQHQGQYVVGTLLLTEAELIALGHGEGLCAL
jgi:hypothetical protein